MREILSSPSSAPVPLSCAAMFCDVMFLLCRAICCCSLDFATHAFGVWLPLASSLPHNKQFYSDLTRKVAGIPSPATDKGDKYVSKSVYNTPNKQQYLSNFISFIFSPRFLVFSPVALLFPNQILASISTQYQGSCFLAVLAPPDGAAQPRKG